MLNYFPQYYSEIFCCYITSITQSQKAALAILVCKRVMKVLIGDKNNQIFGDGITFC